MSSWSIRILITWIIILSILYSTLSILRHDHFQSGGFDLGLYDQAVWQYSRLQWPYNTIKDRFILGDHLTLTLPILSPLFWLWDNVRILLIFQAVWISVSAFAIYKIALLRLGKGNARWISLCVAVVYSLFYGIQYLVYFDFHPVVIGVGLLAWAAYFLEAGKMRLFVASVIFLLLTQENMGIALAGLGFIYLFRAKYHRIAITCIVGGVAYSLLASKIISFFSPTGFQYWPQLTFDPRVIVPRFFDSEEKRQVWLYSLATFSFLPLLSVGAMLAVILDLAQYFVTGMEFSRMWSPFMHHRAILGVFLVLGTIDALVYLKHRAIRPQRVALVLLGVAFVLQYVWHMPLNKLTKLEYWKAESWMGDNRKMFATIPVNAAIATQQNLVPYLSHRNKIYLVWPRPHDFNSAPCGQVSCWWLDFDNKAEYLAVDTRSNQWLTQILESNEHWTEAISNMEKTGRITLAESVGAARLYRVKLSAVVQ